MFISEDRKRQMNNLSFIIRFISLDNIEQELTMKTPPWTRIKELKSRVSKEYNLKNQVIRLFYKNIEMINSLTVLDYQFTDTKENVVHYRIDNSKYSKQGNIQVYGSFPSDKKLNKTIEEIKLGFITGLHPQGTEFGTSGTYFFKSITKEIVAVFKPIDEEAFAPNNQKGYPGKFGSQSFRKGILSGEGNIREVAASILDSNNKKMFKVPETTFVEVNHKAFVRSHLNMMMNVESNSYNKIKTSIIHNYVMENFMPAQLSNLNKLTNISNLKCFTSNAKNCDNNENFVSSPLSIKTENSDDYCDQTYNTLESNANFSKKYGSLQKFVHNTEVAADFCSDLFSIEEVQKMAILDLRILNCDRNDENILVIK